MTKGRGKNAPDRAELMCESGVEIVEAAPMPCPEYMPEAAGRLWGELTKQAFALKLLRPEDAFLLEQLCMQYQVWTDARDSYLRMPVEMRTREITETGSKMNSDISVMNKAGDQMVKLAKLLGISPMVRAQLNLNNAASAALMATAVPDKVKRLYEASKHAAKNG